MSSENADLAYARLRRTPEEQAQWDRLERLKQKIARLIEDDDEIKAFLRKYTQ